MLGEGLGPRSNKSAARTSGPSSAAIAAQRLGGGRAAAARRRSEPGFAARLKARLPRIRPFKVLTVSAFSIALVGIVANAMIFQRGHHPAPLFGLGRSVDGQPEAAPPSVVERSAPVATPAVPAPREPAALAPPPPAPPVVVDPTPRAAAAVPPKPVHHAAPKPHQVDAIGGLLSAAPKPAAHPRPGAVASKPSAAAKPAPVTDAAGTASHAKPVTKPDHKTTTLAQSDAAHHVTTGTTAHPRPHAKPESGKVPSQAKADTAAKPAAKPE